MAVTASGGATGSTILPLVAHQLLPNVGFGFTLRTMGFVMFFNTVVILSIARVRLPPRKIRPLVEWNSFREALYTLFCTGLFFQSLGWLLCILLLRSFYLLTQAIRNNPLS
jgi:hypothetical protein